MENAAERPPGEICHRCLQPIAPNAQRCRNCGERHSPANRLPIFLGVLGLLLLAFVAIVMLKVIRNSDTDSAPSARAGESTPQTPGGKSPLNP